MQLCYLQQLRNIFTRRGIVAVAAYTFLYLLLPLPALSQIAIPTTLPLGYKGQKKQFIILRDPLASTTNTVISSTTDGENAKVKVRPGQYFIRSRLVNKEESDLVYSGHFNLTREATSQEDLALKLAKPQLIEWPKPPGDARFYLTVVNEKGEYLVKNEAIKNNITTFTPPTEGTYYWSVSNKENIYWNQPKSFLAEPAKPGALTIEQNDDTSTVIANWEDQAQAHAYRFRLTDKKAFHFLSES